MSQYAFDIWNAEAPILLVGGLGSFDIWNAEAPFVQDSEPTEGVMTLLAAGDSTATAAFIARYQMLAQADGTSTATVSISGTGNATLLAAGDSSASVTITGTLVFNLQAAGDSSALITLSGYGSIVPAPFAGVSSATVNELIPAPFSKYPPTLIFGF